LLFIVCVESVLQRIIELVEILGFFLFLLIVHGIGAFSWFQCGVNVGGWWRQCKAGFNGLPVLLGTRHTEEASPERGQVTLNCRSAVFLEFDDDFLEFAQAFDRVRDLRPVEPAAHRFDHLRVSLVVGNALRLIDACVLAAGAQQDML